MKNQLLSAGSLKDDTIKNSEGKDIGNIQEIMLNPQTGKIEYAVLSFGGFLGLGDKYFAVPWDALELNREEKCFRLDVDKEKLENSPGFDKDDWPDFADDTFLHSVNKNYHGVGSHTYQTQ